MVARSLLVLGLAALAGCLRTPELRDCAEFPVTENPDACGSPCDIYCDVLVDACPDQVGGEDKARACRSSCIEIDAGGGNVITLTGVKVGALEASDFLF